MYFHTNVGLSSNDTTRWEKFAEPPQHGVSSFGQFQIDPPQSIVSRVFGVDVPIKRFECSPDALLRIQAVTGFTTTHAGTLSKVRLQAGNAAGVAKKAADRLASPDGNVISAFQNTFGKTPDAFPTSSPRPGAWNLGKIVRQRFLGAHRLLTSGALLYSCWGRPRKAGGPEVNPNYLVLAQPGQYWIALGRLYWEADRNGDVDTTTHAFLFAALRAYYGPLLSDATPTQAPSLRVIRNIHCYIQFVVRLFNSNLPTWVDINCSKTA
jgi:hypothetical protein